MITKICQYCGKEFETNSCWVKRGGGKYCSKKCHYLSQSKRIEKNCLFCNKIFETKSSNLHSKFCSKECYNNFRQANKKFTNLTGKRFGRLIVTKYIGKDKNNFSLWYCECDCGKHTITRKRSLIKGRAKSCGCWQKEVIKKLNTKPRIKASHKRCPTCSETKEAQYFGKDETRPDGLTSQCKHCKYVVYRQKNRGKINAWSAKRKKHIKQATPTWVDFKEIEKIYDLAIKKTEETGILHHVDHIIPINGKDICGLHVPQNLQIITASENCSKQNKFDIYKWNDIQ